MSINTSRVFAAWAGLSDIERNEVVQLINKYQQTPSSVEQQKLKLEHLHESQRSFSANSGTTMNFGPAPGSCPACGR